MNIDRKIVVVSAAALILAAWIIAIVVRNLSLYPQV
jgi:hypothetical protein